MPLGLAARLNLATALASGSLRGLLPPWRRPRVVSADFETRPVVGQPVRLLIKTNRAGAAFVHIEQQGGVVLCDTPAPVNGYVTITAPSPNPIYVTLTLQPMRMRAGSEPVKYYLPPVVPVRPRPRILRFEAPRTASQNGEFDVVWDVVDATGIDLIIDDGRTIIREVRHASGVRKVVATHAGTWVVRLTAQGTHAAVTESRSVVVTVPRPRIYIERGMIAGPPGTRGHFAWRMTDTVRAILHAPSRDQRCAAPLEGGFAAEVGRTSEYFVLVAIGLNGLRATAELRTEPYHLMHLSRGTD